MPNYRVYHGTGVEFEEFQKSSARVKNDHYGGIAYFTDNVQIARQYASAQAKNAGSKNKVIYTVNLNIQNLFDVKQVYQGSQLTKILRNVSNLEQFARNAGLLSYGVDKYEVLAQLKSGQIALTGDQIFLGLSMGQQNTEKTRNLLKKCGFDGLKYYGAKIFGTIPHTVYLPYNMDSIKIVDVKIEK